MTRTIEATQELLHTAVAEGAAEAETDAAFIPFLQTRLLYVQGTLDQEGFESHLAKAKELTVEGYFGTPSYLIPSTLALGKIAGLDIKDLLKIEDETEYEAYNAQNQALFYGGARKYEPMLSELGGLKSREYWDRFAVSAAETLFTRNALPLSVRIKCIPFVFPDLQQADVLDLIDAGNVLARGGLFAPALKINEKLTGPQLQLRDFTYHRDYAQAIRNRAKDILYGANWALETVALAQEGTEVDTADLTLAATVISQREHYFGFDDTETSLFIAAGLALRACELHLPEAAAKYMHTADTLANNGAQSRLGVAGLVKLAFARYALEKDEQKAHQDCTFALQVARTVVPNEQAKLHEEFKIKPQAGAEYVHDVATEHPYFADKLAGYLELKKQWDISKIAISLALQEEHFDRSLEIAGTLEPRERLFVISSILSTMVANTIVQQGRASI